jgi:hypothetical protein
VRKEDALSAMRTTITDEPEWVNVLRVEAK